MHKMPKTHIGLRDLLIQIAHESKGNIVASLEDVVGNAGGTQTAQQGMSLGRNLGRLEMALLCLNIKTVKVKPADWQTAFKLGQKSYHGDKWKHHILAKLGEMMPELSVFLYAADSVFIALYTYQREYNTKALPI